MNTYGKIMPDGQPAGANRNTPEKAVSAFEKLCADNGITVFAYKELVKLGWLACAAEAERLCFEQEKECKHDNPCHAADADAIAQLREVDR